MNEALTKIMEEQRKLLKDKHVGSVDRKCPFTGGLKVRGRMFTGIVVSKDTHRTVKVAWTSKFFVNKFERFMEKRTKISAHNPDIINAQVGDKVIIAECKPLSKTKSFVVIKNLGHSKEYMIKKENIDEDKKVADQEKSKKKADVPSKDEKAEKKPKKTDDAQKVDEQ